MIAVLIYVTYSCFINNERSDINTLLSLIYSKFQATTAPNSFSLSNEASCDILNDCADQTPLSIHSNNNGGEHSPSIGQLNFFKDNFWLVTSTLAEDNLDQLHHHDDFMESSPLTQGNQIPNI